MSLSLSLLPIVATARDSSAENAAERMIPLPRGRGEMKKNVENLMSQRQRVHSGDIKAKGNTVSRISSGVPSDATRAMQPLFASPAVMHSRAVKKKKKRRRRGRTVARSKVTGARSRRRHRAMSRSIILRLSTTPFRNLVADPPFKKGSDHKGQVIM